MIGRKAQEWALEALNTAWREWDDGEQEWRKARTTTLLRIEQHLSEVRRMEKSVEMQDRQIALCVETKAALDLSHHQMSAHFKLDRAGV